MSTLRRLLSWCPLGWVRHIPRALSTGELVPYLNRYTLRRQNESGANPWRVYLHEFLSPDSEGHHDHPSTWGFSLVLWGSYTEEVLNLNHHTTVNGVAHVRNVHPRRVRWWNYIPASKYHRITELHPWPGARGVWTLFICGPLRRDPQGRPKGWGFWIPGRGHVDHTEVESTAVKEVTK